MGYTDTIGHNEIRRLIELEESPCVSIYLPTHEGGPEAQQDRIRLKNMLREAERELTSTFLDGSGATALLAPARKLLENPEFWKYQGRCLALFLSLRGMRTFRLPGTPSELVYVGDSFHVKPLISLITENASYYVLAISQNEIRFFEGTRLAIEQIDLPGMPRSVSEVLGFYEEQRHLQSHTGTRGVGSSRASLFHSRGTGKDIAQHKHRLREYFQRIDAVLMDYLKHSSAPLIFAGVEYLFPLYKEVCSYPFLLEDILPGNPQTVDMRTLHEKAWQIVKPRLINERKQAYIRFRDMLASGEGSSDLREIIPAAIMGRVDTLFIPVGYHEWGTFRPEDGKVEIHGEKQPGDRDLFDIAALHTFFNGGTVYALNPGDLQEPFPIGAIYRYALAHERTKRRVNE